jgi:glucose/arabinose dehydrogenase
LIFRTPVYNARAFLIQASSMLTSNIVSFVLAGVSFLLLAACAPQTVQTFRATPVAQGATAPIYTATFTVTPSATHTLTPTLTPSATLTATPTLTSSPTRTMTLTPTQPLYTLTAPSPDGAPPPFSGATPVLSATDGWTCGDFPCEDDVEGFLRRIQVPEGYRVELYGRFPGQVMQIAVGPDERLYATVLERGTRSGAVYALAPGGEAERYSSGFVSPVGLAFQPGTDVLYVSARVTLERGGGLWRVPAGGGMPEPVITDLPCCFMEIDNQPNGIVFGPDGYLYMGVGALTDHAEPSNPARMRNEDIQPLEASILRIQPHTGDIEVYAEGLRNPYDLTFTSDGQLYATDSGLLTGEGDRLLKVNEGAHLGWPYWTARGCEGCPPMSPRLEITPDLYSFPPYTLPRGIVAYTGAQFPRSHFDALFVALWNAVEGGQQIVRIDPQDINEEYVPEPFVTGLIRPVDVALAPGGSLLVADYVYGYVWRVVYEG